MAIKHRIRNGKGGNRVAKFTARGAIYEFCKMCMGWSVNEVKVCTDPLCPLFPFRRPGRPQGVTDLDKQKAIVERHFKSQKGLTP